ncbi:MAG: Rne/Rng family ribonuclease [Bryobacterales bacterium]|nr:Rne/Rng family ribonuclease [Bryobacterales bacterium]MBV9398313.1 Rne/Rng family ribonuclease [Bryobacterales bacterium]
MSSKEMVISSNGHETRVALLEEDQLVEVYFQRANEYSLAGSIHKGRVTRVLPGMQSAFVDLGLERDTFLYVSDFLEEHEDIDRVTVDERPGRGDRDRGRDRRHASPPQRTEPIPPQVVVEAGKGAAEPAIQPEIAAAAPQTPSGERADDRGDRRGRRSRRRRNRGRGFPESKYAPAPEAVAEALPQTAEASVEAARAGVAQEHSAEELPLVLPGESLAKYRASAAAIDVAPAPPEFTSNGALEPAPAETENVSEVDETEFDEPIHYPPENALPDAPVHPHAAAVQAEAEMSEVEEAGEPELPAIEEPEFPASGADAASIASPAISWLEEDTDIQEMILGAVEQPDDAPGEPDEPELTSAAEPGVEAGLEAPAEAVSAAPESGSAEVRERGGRYPHRISRRMRRRMRGGQADSREQTGAAEQRPAQAEPARSEARTVSRPATSAAPSISELLKEGQEIIVQIAKEPLGQKGARITSHIALPGRYVVYMPTLEHMGVSRKIGSDEERLRLKRVLQSRRPGPVGGFITRTAAEGRTEDEIAADMEFLYKLWQDIKNKADRKPAPSLLHHDLDIVQRVLRDQLTGTFKAIWIDNDELYENVVGFVQRFQPALIGKVKLYTREAPIFDAFGITAELEKALRPKVWLKSGGYIVINQTEALVAIDVNTGKFVGKSNRLEDTIVKTNTEAIKEIVRQVRLRDLGGIIVIDFIDMDERKNRQKVMQSLEEGMRADRAPYKILQFNDFGLVAITRKRVKQSLERTLCAPCPHCDGAGYIKSVQTVVGEILTEARKMASSVEGKDVMLRVHPDVAKVLKSHQNKYLEELEEVLRRPVMVKSDALLHHEKFDLA